MRVSRNRLGRRSPRRGDTLYEVMIALLILSIGVLGITSTQSTISRSMRDAAETNVALTVARTWRERIKRDALLWTQPGAPPRGAILTGRTVPAAATTYFAPGVTGWGAPVPLHTAESSGANSRGVDVGALDPLTGAAVTAADIYYCTLVQFQPLQFDATGINLEIMRAVVRVWWSRSGSAGSSNYGDISAARQNGCDGAIPNFNNTANSVRFVELTETLTYTR